MMLTEASIRKPEGKIVQKNYREIQFYLIQLSALMRT